MCYVYRVTSQDLIFYVLSKINSIISSFRIDLPVRKNDRKCELKGIFVGAKVIRGFNWEWGDQDGGEGACSKMLIFCVFM